LPTPPATPPRTGHHRPLRLRRTAHHRDDRPPQNLPGHRRTALLRLRRPHRPLPHLPPRGRRRRTDRQPTHRRTRAHDDARLPPNRPARHLHGPTRRVRPPESHDRRARHALHLDPAVRRPPRRPTPRRPVRHRALVRHRTLLRL